ncbi:MAG: thioredoxin-disulfide reductase [Minisyncoccia bacterium]
MTQDFNSQNLWDCIIIGGGPAGLTAGIYSGRAMLKTVLFKGRGGEMSLAINVEDFPGFPSGISGLELLSLIEEQNKKFGVVIKDEEIEKVDFSIYPFKLVSSKKEEYLAKSVIIATGASNRWLGLENEKELIGKGISVCAICDGAFFKNQIVAVVGGGDVALENALYLTKYAQKVYVIHRRDELRASKIFQEEAFKNEKIEFLFNFGIKKIIGDKWLEKIVIENNKNLKQRELEVKGLFISIGYEPNTSLFKGQIELEENGYIKVKDNVKTSKEGVFACGDVCDFKYRQVITAAGLGAMAAIEAERWLKKRQKLITRKISLRYLPKN